MRNKAVANIKQIIVFFLINSFFLPGAFTPGKINPAETASLSPQITITNSSVVDTFTSLYGGKMAAVSLETLPSGKKGNSVKLNFSVLFPAVVRERIEQAVMAELRTLDAVDISSVTLSFQSADNPYIDKAYAGFEKVGETKLGNLIGARELIDLLLGYDDKGRRIDLAGFPPAIRGKVTQRSEINREEKIINWLLGEICAISGYNKKEFKKSLIEHLKLNKVSAKGGYSLGALKKLSGLLWKLYYKFKLPWKFNQEFLTALRENSKARFDLVIKLTNGSEINKEIVVEYRGKDAGTGKPIFEAGIDRSRETTQKAAESLKRLPEGWRQKVHILESQIADFRAAAEALEKLSQAKILLALNLPAEFSQLSRNLKDVQDWLINSKVENKINAAQYLESALRLMEKDNYLKALEQIDSAAVELEKRAAWLVANIEKRVNTLMQPASQPERALTDKQQSEEQAARIKNILKQPLQYSLILRALRLNAQTDSALKKQSGNLNRLSKSFGDKGFDRNKAVLGALADELEYSGAGEKPDTEVLTKAISGIINVLQAMAKSSMAAGALGRLRAGLAGVSNALSIAREKAKERNRLIRQVLPDEKIKSVKNALAILNERLSALDSADFYGQLLPELISYLNARQERSLPAAAQLPQQDIFMQRIKQALREGYFEKFFGRQVECVDIQEAGDKHLLLEVSVRSLSEVENEALEIKLPDISDEILENMGNDKNIRVFSFRYWVKKEGKIRKVEKNILSSLALMPGEISMQEKERLLLDYFGRQITAELLHNKTAVVDSAKKLVFRDAQGKTYGVTYLPFNAVVMEKLIQEITRILDYNLYRQLEINKDEFGEFAFSKYIEHSPAAQDGNIILGQKQAMMLGRILPIYYILAFGDATIDNLLLSREGNIIPIDWEVVFSWEFFGNFEEFEDAYLNYQGNRSYLFGLKKTEYRRAYLAGIRETCRILKDKKDILINKIDEMLNNQSLNVRILLADTREYHDELRLKFVVPYYLAAVSFSGNRAELRRQVYNRINELEKKVLVETAGQAEIMPRDAEKFLSLVEQAI